MLHIVSDDVGVDPAHQLVAPNSIRSQALDLLLAGVRHGELAESAALRGTYPSVSTSTNPRSDTGIA